MTQNKVMILLDMLAEHEDLEMIQIRNLDIIYNPHMNNGEWQIFDHDSDHTEYDAYTDIYECATVIVCCAISD